MKPKQT